MSALERDIPELAALSHARGLIRIPLEQDVPLTSRVRAIIDTAPFQRLSRITQLGLSSRVYPGATHTRFEHSLGVYHNALLYLQQLSHDPRFAGIVSPHIAEVLIAAALVHDVGHWPFCHPIEDLELPRLPDHEEFAREYLAPGGELCQVLKTQWGIEPDEVLSLLNGPHRTPAEKLVGSILSGPIDIDKMDYLHRDSLHAGVPYGRNFDRNRLIRSLIVNEAGDGLALSSKGRTAAELMVFARHVMFGEVYWHHAVRSATSMFTRAFYECHAQLDLKSLFRMDEFHFIAALKSQLAGNPCGELLEGVFGDRRMLFKRIGEFSHFQSPQVYQLLARKSYAFLLKVAGVLAEVLSDILGQPIRSTDVIIDAPPARREIEFRVQIFYDKERLFRSLQQVSPVVESMARTQFDDSVKRVRVFVHPEVRSRIPADFRLEQALQQAYNRAQANLFPTG